MSSARRARGDEKAAEDPGSEPAGAGGRCRSRWAPRSRGLARSERRGADAACSGLGAIGRGKFLAPRGGGGHPFSASGGPSCRPLSGLHAEAARQADVSAAWPGRARGGPPGPGQRLQDLGLGEGAAPPSRARARARAPSAKLPSPMPEELLSGTTGLFSKGLESEQEVWARGGGTVGAQLGCAGQKGPLFVLGARRQTFRAGKGRPSPSPRRPDFLSICGTGGGGRRGWKTCHKIGRAVV